MKTLWRLTETFDLCHCQQRVNNKVLRWNFVIDQILIFHHNLQIKFFKSYNVIFWIFFLILSLIFEVYLWWKLQASLIFLSGRTCTIGGWLNKFLPHCIYIYKSSFVNLFIWFIENIWLYIYIYIYIYRPYLVPLYWKDWPHNIYLKTLCVFYRRK